MDAQERRAGPGRDRRSEGMVGMEAAGPASPRLVVEEISVGVGREAMEVAVTLALGSLRFTGIRADTEGGQSSWQLAAAATVDSIQQHLRHAAAEPTAPQIQLLGLTAVTTGTRQEVIQAAIRLVDDNQQVELLGSSLVRNDRCSTAVAAALDAANRKLTRLLFPQDIARVAPSVVSQEPTVEPTEHLRPSETASPLLVGEETSPPPAAELNGSGSQAVESPEEELTLGAAEIESGSNGSGAQELVVAEAEPSGEGEDPTVFTFPKRHGGDLALAIEISPTSVRAVAVESEGKVLAEERRPSRATAEAELTLEAAVEAARAAIAGLNSSANRLAAIGVTMPGRLRPSEGVCVSCGDFPAWREVPVADPFAEAFGLPVSLIGTTQAAALGETQFGSAQGLSNLLYVRIGIDIDVAVISNGRPLMLSEASPGQVGHMVVAPGGPRCSCGEVGCWQAVAGREALVARAVRDIGSGVPSALSVAAGNRPGAVTPALICQLAASGDGVARSALEETGRYLALGLANLVTLFDPEAVIVEAMPTALGVALRHAAEVALKASPRAHALSRCVLLAPALGDRGPALGAAAWAARDRAGRPRVVA